MDIEKVYRLNNEYRALIAEAKSIRTAQGDVSSREEGLCYQYASQIAGQLASMNIGTESEHWISRQQKCNDMMKKIWRDIHPEDTNCAAAKPHGEKEESQSKATKPTATSKAAKKDNSTVSDETVARWFQDMPDHGFDDVVGMDDVKAMLRNCVKQHTMEALDDYLGLSTVHSYFFYGPPGCGKTYIIEAFAHELMLQGYQFMKLESADIHSKFSGEADKIVKRAFEEAVAHEPCILFMDEIDGICQNRSMPNLSDFNMTLTTTFLTSYNNLTKANKQKKNVIFVGATNYPANVDVAMLDRVELVRIPLPDDKLRAYSFKSKFEKIVQLSDDLSWEEMSEATECYNQRDIDRIADNLKKNLKNELAERYFTAEDAVAAMKDGSFRLNREMFERAMSAYTPTPKDDVEKKLNDFEDKMRSM